MTRRNYGQSEDDSSSSDVRSQMRRELIRKLKSGEYNGSREAGLRILDSLYVQDKAIVDDFVEALLRPRE